MWAVLGVAVIVLVVAYLVLSKPRAAARQEPVVTVSVSSVYDHQPKVSTEAVQGGSRIGSNLPFPLTLLGIKPADAERLAKAVQAREYDEFAERLVLLIAKDNVRCVEVEQWAAEARAKVDAAVKAAIAASSEWGSASELDRKDMLAAFRLSGIEALAVRPEPQMAAVLLEGPPTNITADDDLSAKFANRPDLYPVLLSAIAGGDKVLTVPADGWRRKEYEQLAEAGFLRRGEAIPLDAILRTLTIKQLTEVAGADAPKKFGRKAAAIEFVQSLPDLKARLGKVVAFRELFQVAPAAGLDLDAIAHSYRYAGELARVIRQTLFSGSNTLREIAYAKGSQPEGWELLANDCCPECMKLDGKTWKRLPSRLPPFHIGCEASISAE